MFAFSNPANTVSSSVQAATLEQKDLDATRGLSDQEVSGATTAVDSAELVKDAVLLVQTGNQIVVDGVVLDGRLGLDESC